MAGSGPLTLAAAVNEAARRLAAARDMLSPRLDAEVLARAILGWDAATWIARQREPASPDFLDAYTSTVDRRRAHEPVAYLTGTREFYGRTFRVSPAVLIPRPETEGLVEAAVRILAERRTAGSPRVADIGTGSGCLAVSIALEWPAALVTATDISPDALAVAAANAATFRVEDRVAFRQTAFFDDLSGPFDLVVSNPPYVPERERPHLARDVVEYEPAGALFGGADGLDVIRRLIPESARVLVPGGWLVLEIGIGQVEAVRGLLADHGVLTFVRAEPDLSGIPRVVLARHR
jgi:release factor glutamine methyltransferase